MSSHTYVKLHLRSTIEPGHLTWIRVHYHFSFGKEGLGLGIGDWGLEIGDWGLGIGGWGLCAH